MGKFQFACFLSVITYTGQTISVLFPGEYSQPLRSVDVGPSVIRKWINERVFLESSRRSPIINSK